MEKTVLVIAANSLSGESCGRPLSLDLSLGKGKASSNTKVNLTFASKAKSGISTDGSQVGVDVLCAGSRQVREGDL